MTPGEQTRDYYRKQGAQQEQDRIIKLLEQAGKDFERHDFGSAVTTNYLVTLIKGETN